MRRTTLRIRLYIGGKMTKGELENGLESQQGLAGLASYPLLEALIERRSRRFGKGFELNGGPLAYASASSPQPLTLEEEAALAFAACGITGYALGELPYQTGKEQEASSGNMIARFLGRTV